MRARVIYAVVYLLLIPSAAMGAPAEPSASEETQVVEHAAADEVDQQAIVESYVKWFFRNSKAYRFEAAKVFVPQVVKAARDAGIDPLLAAIVISYESTWRPKAVGTAGELGLMQVHGRAAEGFDTSTIDGNLAAGCHWLASRIAATGSVEAGMAAYRGSGESAAKSAAWRMQKYQDERKRQGLD